MLDIGWTELFVLGIVLIVVVGPKDLPPMLRAFGRMTGNLRKMAGEFRSQFDEALRESEMDEVRKTISDVQKLNPTNALRDAVNPLRQMGNEIRSDLEKSTRIEKQDVEAQKAVEGVIPAEQPAPVAVPEPTMALPATPPVVSQPAPVAGAAASKPARKKPAPKAAVAGEAQAAVEGAKPKRPRASASKAPVAEARKPASRKQAEKTVDTPKDEA
ncbi:Sec-independent protein translocase protein TatB [Rhizobium halophilum]|uniref:Sec-independent protein translocase protein TatB n=1 Tax=Rhizobium halophilum TaxID=2846852 RepID=UPI001EFE9768|nr:Sec-independent protein translocase protein TatB [Rhizobium halophilum]MCF6370724.1 Sec-independent protein translocase protein TatB [Rhizobium halophilum]